MSQLTTRYNIIICGKSYRFSSWRRKCYSNVDQNAKPSSGFTEGSASRRHVIQSIVVPSRSSRISLINDRENRISSFPRDTRVFAITVLSLSADIILDTRVVFTTLNVTRPTSHLFYISRWEPRLQSRNFYPCKVV